MLLVLFLFLNSEARKTKEKLRVVIYRDNEIEENVDIIFGLSQ